MSNIVAWERMPARPARYGPWPGGLDPRLEAALIKRGLGSLYTHQALAVEAALRGENVVVVTGTASGKTLCYNLPVLHSLLADPQARALYLFPTKALAQDQAAELSQFVDVLSHTPSLPSPPRSPSAPTTATRRNPSAPPSVKPAGSSFPTPICSTPAFCRITRAGPTCLPTSSTWCSTKSTPTAACLARTWPTCSGGCGASAPSMAPRPSSSAPRPPLPTPRLWPKSWWKRR